MDKVEAATVRHLRFYEPLIKCFAANVPVVVNQFERYRLLSAGDRNLINNEPIDDARALRFIEILITRDCSFYYLMLYLVSNNNEPLANEMCQAAKKQNAKTCCVKFAESHRGRVVEPPVEWNLQFQPPGTARELRNESERNVLHSSTECAASTAPPTPIDKHGLPATVEALKKALVTLYSNKDYSVIKLFATDKNGVAIRDTYVPIRAIVREPIKGQRGHSVQRHVTEADLLLEAFSSDRPSLIVLLGDAGQGKTTFVQKLAHDWAQTVLTSDSSDAHSGFQKFELVIAFQLRNLQTPIAEIVAVLNVMVSSHRELAPLNEKAKMDEIKEWIDENPSKVLFILDGVDELQNWDMCSELSEILISPFYSTNHPLLLTSRSHGPILERSRCCEHCFEICALTKESAVEMIQKYCASAEKQRRDEIEQFCLKEANEFILSSPLLLRLLCYVAVLCGRRQVLPTSRVDIYLTICEYLVLHRKREKVESDKKIFLKHDLSVAEEKAAIAQLHNVNSANEFQAKTWICSRFVKNLSAFAMSRELEGESLVFPRSVIEWECGVDVCDAAVDLGFVTSDCLFSSNWNRPQNEVNFSFPHKSFQEFFAAIFFFIEPNDEKVTQLLRKLLEAKDSDELNDEFWRLRHIFHFILGLADTIVDEIGMHAIQKLTTALPGPAEYNVTRRRNYVDIVSKLAKLADRTVDTSTKALFGQFLYTNRNNFVNHVCRFYDYDELDTDFAPIRILTSWKIETDFFFTAEGSVNDKSGVIVIERRDKNNTIKALWAIQWENRFLSGRRLEVNSQRFSRVPRFVYIGQLRGFLRLWKSADFPCDFGRLDLNFVDADNDDEVAFPLFFCFRSDRNAILPTERLKVSVKERLNAAGRNLLLTTLGQIVARDEFDITLAMAAIGSQQLSHFSTAADENVAGRPLNVGKCVIRLDFDSQFWKSNLTLFRQFLACFAFGRAKGELNCVAQVEEFEVVDKIRYSAGNRVDSEVASAEVWVLSGILTCNVSVLKLTFLSDHYFETGVVQTFCASAENDNNLRLLILSFHTATALNISEGRRREDQPHELMENAKLIFRAIPKLTIRLALFLLNCHLTLELSRDGKDNDELTTDTVENWIWNVDVLRIIQPYAHLIQIDECVKWLGLVCRYVDRIGEICFDKISSKHFEIIIARCSADLWQPRKTKLVKCMDLWLMELEHDYTVSTPLFLPKLPKTITDAKIFCKKIASIFRCCPKWTFVYLCGLVSST